MRVPFCDLRKLHAPILNRLDAVYCDVVHRSQFVLGESVASFETEWARYCAAKHAIGTGNALDAIRLMMQASDIGSGDEVIVPSNTYVATWLAVMALGAIPIPVEPSDDGVIHARGVLDAISERTRAILAVHLYGRQAPMRDLQTLATAKGLLLFVDAAQGHGLEHAGDGSAFSFYPTKNLGALGDAGAVVTNSDVLAERVRALRNYGSTQKNFHYYAGCNSRLDEMQAAFLLAKLPHLDQWNRRRAETAAFYDEAFGVKRDGVSVNHLYVIRVANRARLQQALGAAGIETAVHYPTPPHLQPCCAPLRYQRGQLPIAEQMASDVLSLPCGPEVSDEQREHVAQYVNALDWRAAA